jgi:hypothetical protein
MVQRIKSPLLIAGLVVILLSVGVAGAAKLITGKEIKNHSITGKDIKKGSVPLSALRSTPSVPGSTGPQGAKGNPGVVGATGPAGPALFSTVGTLTGPIPSSIAPSGSLKFVGEPAEVFLASGYRGAVEATVTVGTTEAPIDDPAEFALAICVDQGFGPEPIEEEAGKFGVSPVLATNDRVAVTVSTGFFVSGEEEEIFPVLFGPCVLNETESALDKNDRTVGYVVASAG